MPGLWVELTSWTREAASFVVTGPIGGQHELGIRVGGRALETEVSRISQVVRLDFREPCPPDAVLVVAWRAERRCLARFEETDVPEARE